MRNISMRGVRVEPLALHDFMDIAVRTVRPSEPESLLELAVPLYRVARDKSLLAKFVNHDLRRWHDDGHLHFYSPQSCRLMIEGPLVVRLNLWPVLPSDPRRRAVLSRVLSYYDYHDHNFSFITANYLGPGYKTNVYEYERDRLLGYPGEHVDLKFVGSHDLDDSTVLFFEQCRDVHQQLPPVEMSASLNLMLNPPGSSLIDQYYFDPDGGIVTGYVESLSSKRVNGLTFAGLVGDDTTRELLERLALAHPCARTRNEAAVQLLKLTDASFIRGPLADALCSTALGRALYDGWAGLSLGLVAPATGSRIGSPNEAVS